MLSLHVITQAFYSIKSMSDDILHEITQSDYKYGFSTDIETEVNPVGLNDDVIRLISANKIQPEW